MNKELFDQYLLKSILSLRNKENKKEIKNMLSYIL